MIDLSLPPYNMVGNWDRNLGPTGADASATAWDDALEDAIGAATLGDDYTDLGGKQGDTLVMPAGCFLFKRPIRLPDGVTLVGSGSCSTLLVPAVELDPAQHFISVGGLRNPQVSSFGGGLRHLFLWGRKEAQANYGTRMIYTNNLQDTAPMFEDLRIYGHERGCLFYETGVGGASIVTMRQLTMVTSRAQMPCLHTKIDPGSGTMFHMDSIEPMCGRTPDGLAPKPGTIGIMLENGRYDINRVHVEQTDSGVIFFMKSSACWADLKNLTRGDVNGNLITIMGSPPQLGKITLERIEGPGSHGHTVMNGQSGASHIDGYINSKITL